jgi:hypothetical protein
VTLVSDLVLGTSVESQHVHTTAQVTSLDAALAAKPAGGQAAIANLNLGSLVLLSDVVTAVGTIQTKVTTLLSELRTSGLIAP